MPVEITVPYGKRCTFRAQFKDAAGALADPTTVRWKVRAPDGTETLYADDAPETEHPSAGIYTFTFTPSTPGSWVIRVEGLGDVEDAADFPIHVPRSRVATAAT
jgi:hypothetical protein